MHYGVAPIDGVVLARLFCAVRVALLCCHLRKFGSVPGASGVLELRLTRCRFASVMLSMRSRKETPWYGYVHAPQTEVG